MRRVGWAESPQGAPALGRPWEGPAPVEGGASVRAALERAVRPGSTPRSPAPASRARTRWFAEVSAWNRDLGAAATAVERWDLAGQGSGLVVITGQQPALWGGPLYTLYKAATAAALADRIERRFGIPTTAVFWVVGDDSDFGEVSTAWIPGSGGLVKVRDGAVPPGGTMIGPLEASRQRALVESHPLALDGWTADREVRAALLEAIERGGDWSGVQAALLHRALPGAPLVVVDGGWASALEAAAPLLESAASWDLARALADGEGAARGAGLEPSLDPSTGEHALFRVLGGTREPLGRVSAAESRKRGDRLAPNVSLRPIVQDYLLPNVATVCGRAEIHYRAQLGPLYAHARVPEPLRVPRLHARLVPRLLPEVLDLAGGREDEAAARAASDPEGFVAALAEAEAPRDLAAALEGIRRRLRDELEALAGPVGEFDASLRQVLESGAGKADYQLRRVAEGIGVKARQRLYRRQRALAHWMDWLRPRDGEQERTLSMLLPWLSEGRPHEDSLLAAATDHLDRLESGEAAAIALFVLDGAGQEGIDG